MGGWRGVGRLRELCNLWWQGPELPGERPALWSLSQFLQPSRGPAHLAHLHARPALQELTTGDRQRSSREKHCKSRRHGVIPQWKGGRAGTWRGVGGCSMELIFEQGLKGWRCQGRAFQEEEVQGLVGIWHS